MVSDLKTVAHIGCQIAVAKKFFTDFFPFSFNFYFCHVFTCLNIILPPLPKVQYPNVLDFWNSWGKVVGKMVSDLKTFAHKVCKIAAQKKVCFSANFALLAGFFLVSVLLSASVERFFVSHMQD